MGGFATQALCFSGTKALGPIGTSQWLHLSAFCYYSLQRCNVFNQRQRDAELTCTQTQTSRTVPQSVTFKLMRMAT